MNTDIIFFYTGLAFWCVLALAVAASLLIVWIFLLVRYIQWTERYRYIILLTKTGLSERGREEIASFLAEYSQEQKRLVYFFIDRLKDKHFETKEESEKRKNG